MNKKKKLKFLKYQIRKSTKELRRKLIRREKRIRRIILIQKILRENKSLNIGKNDRKKQSQLVQRINHEIKFRNYTHIKAPPVLSFLKNTVKVLEFIHKIEVSLKRKRSTFIVLKDTIEIQHDALVVLLSIMMRFRDERIDFNGDFPRNSVAKQVLLESQFFTKLYESSRNSIKNYSTKTSSIHTRTNKKVNVELASRLILESSEIVWSIPMRCPGIYRMLIELMTNTHNHAEIGKKGSENWYLCVVHLKEQRKVIFTFVDYGVGVINSLQNKKPGDKMFGFLTTITNFFSSPPNNAEIIREIFLAEKQVSSTGNYYRGYGLPSLYNSFLDGDIQNFNYITNNVHLDATKEEFNVLSEDFSGTFVYWELNDNCNHLNTLQ